MVRFRNILPLILFLTTLHSSPLYAKAWEKDPDYLRAMAYLQGKIGVRKGIREIKNCPYAKCDEVADQSDGNIKKITVRTKNYPRMVAHFKKSVEKGNPLAAAKLAKFLLGRIDYRSRVPDPLLIKIGERDTGMAYADYLALAKRSLMIAADHKDCYSMYKTAEFRRKGKLGFVKDPQKAQLLYREIVKTCDPKSFFTIMSKNRIGK